MKPASFAAAVHFRRTQLVFVVMIGHLFLPSGVCDAYLDRCPPRFIHEADG
jgi:hypothetical protein